MPVPYASIVGTTVVTPGAAPAVAQPAPLAAVPAVASAFASADGFRFPTAEAMSTYEIKRCKLDVLDARSGTWQQQGETKIAPLVGVPTTSSATGQFVDSVVAQYRISRGEGVVLATFSGPMLYQSKRLFEYLGSMDAWNAHSHREGAEENVRHAHRVMEAASAGVVGAGILTDLVAVGIAASQPSGTGTAAAADAVGAGTGLIATGLMWNILNRVPPASHLVADPWNVEDVMPYVRAYNTALREQLSGATGAQ